ncbi:MAG TPA: YhcH/YjgK/YiaL family protein [Pirellulales bacterium]|jgi:YhcH/YjgK/YiaL family protein|nr:YhcH/YjgK/YiaL family protein [Pirellulales bacterium]
MILDRLANWERYVKMHPGFKPAFDFLRRPESANLPSGKHSLDGERLYVMIVRETARGRQRAKLESHRKYIDIQFTVAGAEEIGWKPTPECSAIESPYEAEKDLALFGDIPESWFGVKPLSFAMFFPEDAHAPLAGQGELHKAVMKVAVNW